VIRSPTEHVDNSYPSGDEGKNLKSDPHGSRERPIYLVREPSPCGGDALGGDGCHQLANAGAHDGADLLARDGEADDSRDGATGKGPVQRAY